MYDPRLQIYCNSPFRLLSQAFTSHGGGTGILSLGWTYLNEANTFEFDCGVNGYAGVRKGVSAQLQAAWKF